LVNATKTKKETILCDWLAMRPLIYPPKVPL
jgi:hypothetical protein